MQVPENLLPLLPGAALRIGVAVLLELADSSVQLGVRPFVKAGDYWNAQFDLRERIKLRFEEEGITIPFPQRDIHLIQPG